MDAQQRLLLEHSAQALAAVSASGGRGDTAVQTSVMVGIGTVDYTAMSAHLGNSLYTASGASCCTLLMAVPEQGALAGPRDG
jgi:acyl transferase domain-containing protein